MMWCLCLLYFFVSKAVSVPPENAGLNVSLPFTSPIMTLTPECYDENNLGREHREPYNEEDCKTLTNQMMASRDERIRPRPYSSLTPFAPGYRTLPYAWYHMDCQFVLMKVSPRGEITIHYSDFDIAMLAARVRRKCDNTDVPIGGFQPFIGPNGEHLAVVVEKSMGRRDRSSTSHDHGRHPTLSTSDQSLTNSSTLATRTSEPMRCLTSISRLRREEVVEGCEKLANNLRTSPRAMGEITYSSGRRPHTRQVPFTWTGKGCKITLRTTSKVAAHMERFSERQLGEQAGKIIKHCLLERQGPSIGGMIKMLPEAPLTKSDFYVRLETPQLGGILRTVYNVSTQQIAAA